MLKNAFNKGLAEGRSFSGNLLEQRLLIEITSQTPALFSEKVRQTLAQKLGIKTLTVPGVQSALRSLQKKNLISQTDGRGAYCIDDPNFRTWLVNIS